MAEEVEIVKRIWSLYEHQSNDLYCGRFLRPYEINREPLLEKCLSQPGFPDLAAHALSLTLKGIYSPKNTHRQVIRGLSRSGVMDYLQNAILFHYEKLVPKFRWIKNGDGHKTAAAFYVYASECLHPEKCHPDWKRNEISFTELLPRENDDPDLLDRILGLGHKRDYYQETQRQASQIKLSDAIEAFKETLTPRRRKRLDFALFVFTNDLGIREHGIDRRTWEQKELRQYLQDSGFRPVTQKNQYDNTTNWPELFLKIKGAYPKRHHLLSPTETKIMDWVVTRKNGQEDLKSCLPAMRHDLEIPDSSLVSLFWRAKRILLHESKEESRIANNHRRHQRASVLAKTNK